MKKNMGTIDRVLRLIAGAALLAYGFLGGLASPWNIVAMVVGVVLVGTAAVSFCPIYMPLGMSTRGKKAEEE